MDESPMRNEHEGYLVKRTKLVGFKKYFVVLKEGQIIYYSNEYVFLVYRKFLKYNFSIFQPLTLKELTPNLTRVEKEFTRFEMHRLKFVILFVYD